MKIARSAMVERSGVTAAYPVAPSKIVLNPSSTAFPSPAVSPSRACVAPSIIFA